MMFCLGSGERPWPFTFPSQRRWRTPRRRGRGGDLLDSQKVHRVQRQISVSVPLPSSFKWWNSLILTDYSEPDYEPAEQLIAATGADIRHGGGRAFYSLAGDFICLPPKTSFIGGAYYATALHELAHWSECAARLGSGEEWLPNGRVDRGNGVRAYLPTELGVPNTKPSKITPAYPEVCGCSAMRENDLNYIFKESRQASKVLRLPPLLRETR